MLPAVMTPNVAVLPVPRVQRQLYPLELSDDQCSLYSCAVTSLHVAVPLSAQTGGTG